MSTAPALDRHADAVRRGAAAALAGLPGMGPRRLTALLDAWDPAQAWERAASGRRRRLSEAPAVAALLGPAADGGEALVRSWAAAAHGVDPEAVAQRHERADVVVHLRDDASYPALLLADVEPPAVLFTRGHPAALDAPRVAIVGTRRCTGLGAGFARELGRDLASAGVAVVSGLALGIDGAAHRGVLDARGRAAAPVGVVGSGLDVVYPARHRDLWHAVADQGLLLGEVPLGQRPAGWRFPARNRVIAALADVVVVVESHAGGGSLHTVTEAIRRDVQVMAVPGSVRSPAAAGTNQLLAEGCHPVRDAQDVLVALGLGAATRGRASTDRRAAPDACGRAVLDALGWEPATFEHLAVRSSLALPELAVALEWLQVEGWIGLAGGWYERIEAA